MLISRLTMNHFFLLPILYSWILFLILGRRIIFLVSESERNFSSLPSLLINLISSPPLTFLFLLIAWLSQEQLLPVFIYMMVKLLFIIKYFTYKENVENIISSIYLLASSIESKHFTTFFQSHLIFEKVKHVG